MAAATAQFNQHAQLFNAGKPGTYNENVSYSHSEHSCSSRKLLSDKHLLLRVLITQGCHFFSIENL